MSTTTKTTEKPINGLVRPQRRIITGSPDVPQSCCTPFVLQVSVDLSAFEHRDWPLGGVFDRYRSILCGLPADSPGSSKWWPQGWCSWPTPSIDMRHPGAGGRTPGFLTEQRNEPESLWPQGPQRRTVQVKFGALWKLLSLGSFGGVKGDHRPPSTLMKTSAGWNPLHRGKNEGHQVDLGSFWVPPLNKPFSSWRYWHLVTERRSCNIRSF